jgi:hypothetical protein
MAASLEPCGKSGLVVLGILLKARPLGLCEARLCGEKVFNFKTMQAHILKSSFFLVF